MTGDAPADGGQSQGRPGGARRRWVIGSAALLTLFAAAQRALSAWTDRPTALASALVLLLVLGVFVARWVVAAGPGAWRLLRSLLSSITSAVATDPEVGRWRRDHPYLSRWIENRITLRRWSGLYLSVTTLAAGYFLALFSSIARSVVSHGGLATYDQAVSTLARAFRTPGLTRGLWVATVAADPMVVLVLTAVSGALLVVWGERSHAALLVACTGLGVAFDSMVKQVFSRPRPPIAAALVKTPGSFSFPSGHAFTSLVFFGLIAFVAVRSVRRLDAKLAVIGSAVAVVLAVGVSRVYLGVHWPTDVLGGWALGLAWLSVAVGAYLTWLRYGRPHAERRPILSLRGRLGVTVVVALATITAVVAGAQYDPLLAKAVASRPVDPLTPGAPVGGLPTLPAGEVARLPAFSEKLDGSYQNPVGLIFIGTRQELVDSFAHAGWSRADQASIANLLRAAVAAIGDRPYPNAPVTPTFLTGRVQDLAFEKPQGQATVRRRHHNRWWQTAFTLAGRPVWVGTASLDTRLEIGSTIPLPTHRIDPDIDAERDYVVTSLDPTGLVAEVGRVRVVPPMRGTDAQGDPWFTGGIASVLAFRGR